jgi:hypothetical protein
MFPFVVTEIAFVALGDLFLRSSRRCHGSAVVSASCSCSRSNRNGRIEHEHEHEHDYEKRDGVHQ